MKYSLLTYLNIGFGLILILEGYALFFKNIVLSIRIIQLISVVTLGLLLVTLGAIFAKKHVKINQSEIKENVN